MSKLREILASEGLIRPSASRRNIGGISASPGYDTKYGTSLTVFLEGDKVEIVLGKWSQIGGVDSMYGAGPTEYESAGRFPAEPSKLARAIRGVMRKDIFLQSAKLKDFQWNLPWRHGEAPDVKGLTVKTVRKVLDAYAMPRDAWEGLYLRPQARPSGGPFTFDPSTTLRDVAQQLKAEGYPTKAPSAGTSARGGRLVLVNGRKVRSLLKLLEASSSSDRKMRTRNGWDMHVFDFGGKEIAVTKRYFSYPVNGNKWVVELL